MNVVFFVLGMVGWYFGLQMLFGYLHLSAGWLIVLFIVGAAVMGKFCFSK